MSQAKLSGSLGDRARGCAAAFALPSTASPAGAAAERGLRIHSFLEHLQSMPRKEALARVDESVREVCSLIDVGEVPRGVAEHAFVYNVDIDAVRLLGRIERREYPPTNDFEVPTTLDLIVAPENNGGRALVLDWKTGTRVPYAAGSMQLKLAAVCAARALGVREIDASIVAVAPDGRLTWDMVAFDACALDAAASEWREVVERVNHARAAVASGLLPDVNAGSWCKWCPAKASCPAFAEEAHAIVAASYDWLATFQGQIANDDGAAEMWQRVERAAEVVAAMRALLERRAAERPIPLPDGRVVAMTTSRSERVRDADVVHGALTEMYGSEVADSACEMVRETTKARIERAVAAVVPRGTGVAEKRRALTVLRDRGGVVLYESRRLEVVEGKRVAKGAA